MKNEDVGNRFSFTTFSPESVKIIAESIGIQFLQDDVLNMIASEATYRLKLLLQDTQKFATHCKRSKVSTLDFSQALKVRGFEPIYSHHSVDSQPFKQAVGTNKDIYFIEEKEFSLQEILSQPLPKVPLEVSVKPHWLAIEGVQPLIPENPVSIPLNNLETTIKETVTRIKELDKDTSKIKMPEMVRLKEPSVHELSVEQQFFYKEVTEACVGADENKRVEALNSLATDPGLSQMLPRITTFIAEGVRVNIAQNNLALLIYLMRMIKAMLDNTTLHLDKYLHELVPSIASCIISRQLCLRPDVDNHWALRDFAARLSSHVCKLFNSSSNGLQSRITRLLSSVLLNEVAPLATYYGAIVGLGELGSEVIKAFLLPHVRNIADRLAPLLDSSTIMSPLMMTSPIERSSAEHIKTAFLRILPPTLRTIKSQADSDDYITDYGEIIGPMLYQSVVKLRQQNVVVATQVATTIAVAANNQLQRPSVPNNSSSSPFSRPATPRNPSTQQATRLVVLPQQQQQQRQQIASVQPVASSIFPLSSSPVVASVQPQQQVVRLVAPGGSSLALPRFNVVPSTTRDA